MEAGKIRYYEFGEFRVDTRRRILSKNDDSLPLSPRNFDLLLVLIENEGQILTHDDLLDRVWEGTFVEQANLKNAISVIRKILGEEANEGSFIRTVPRRGYSFVAPVRLFAEDLPTDEREVALEGSIDTDDGHPRSIGYGGSSAPNQINGRSKFLGKYWAVATGFALIAISVIGYGVWRWQTQASPRLSVENIKLTKLTSKGTLNGAVVSSDGNYFVYATIESEGSSLWVQQIATGSATRLTPTMKASFWFYTFSPDNNYVYYTVNKNPDAQQNGLFKVPLFGGAAERVTENTDGFTFSPNGKRISFARTIDGVINYITANPDFSDEKLVATFGEDSRLWSIHWLPDSSGLLFAVRKFVGDKTVHYVVEFSENGGEGRIIVPEMEKQITSAVWLPDKSSLLICLREVNAEIRQIWQYDPSGGELKRVTNDDNSYKGLSMTRDGKAVVTLSEDLLASAWTADDERFDFKQITGGAVRMASVGSLADGRLVYTSTNNGLETVSIVNRDGSNARQITTGNDGIWLFPRVSLDGNSLVIASSRTGRKQLFRLDLEGRNPIQLTHFEDDVFKGQLLSDNKTVVFEGARKDHVPTLFKQATDGTLTALTTENVEEWDISPDEKYLAFAATERQSRQRKVFIISLESGWLYKMLEIQPQWMLRWTRDSRALTYNTRESDVSELYLYPIDNGAPRMLTKISGEQIFSFDWSFDGKRLSIIRGKQLNDAVQLKLSR